MPSSVCRHRWLPLVCAVLAAAAGSCTCGDAALSVTVEIEDAATTTRCVIVAARPAGAPEAATGPIAREGRSSLSVAVYQGELPESVSVLARGYDDLACTRLNEESVPNAVRFVRGQLPRVTLHLRGSPCVGADAGTPCPSGVCRTDQACADAGTEFDCLNGSDDDGDGRTDCLDQDCLSIACASADQCLVAPVCQADGGCSGQSKACEMPPTFCYASPGTCSPGSGACSYTADTTTSCDDSSECTTTDRCLADGGCGGIAVTCNTPPNTACFASPGTCDPATGCSYAVKDAGCNDGNLCTSNDRCTLDGSCAGAAYTCPVTDCTTRACLGDGGCAAPVARTGQACDGGSGVCSPSGNCLAFPYDPSNFDPGAIAATLVLPDGGVPGTVSLTCNAWYNSTDGGISWCAGQPLPAATAVAQTGGPEAVVLAMTGLSVTGSLTLVGSRPVILAIYGDANINGTISAASSLTTDAGSGSSPAGCNAENGFVDGNNTAGGGGGGSLGSRGEDGGNGSSTGHGGRPGTILGVASLEPLIGGCKGGNGGRSTSTSGGLGGAGGGAVQISTAGNLTIPGTVTASAAGGGGASSGGTGANGGGGGGSGGAVLLEGWNVLIPLAARLTANGGGGGEASNDSTTDGFNGGNGSTTALTAAAGGGDNTPCGGNGGGGAAAAALPQAGANSTSGCGGGGGGGGLGRIRINGPNGCQVDAGVQSPRASFSGSCP